MVNHERRTARCACWGLVLGILAITSCANPELTYVERETLPASPVDAGHTDAGFESSDARSGSIETQTTRDTSSRQSTNESEGGPETESTQYSDAGDAVQPDANGSTHDDPRGSVSDAGTHDAGRLDAASSSSAATDAGTVDPRVTDAAVVVDSSAATSEPADSTACDCPITDDPCLQAVCLLGTVCTFAVLTGTACDDGNPCTVSDTCDILGGCEGSPKDCSALDSACSDGVCDEDTGECTVTHFPEATACDDENDCTSEDECDGAGLCRAGSVRDCSAFTTSCTLGLCDGASGECFAEPTNAGGECDDQDACTRSDVCDDTGQCQGESVDCSAESGDCSVGVCDPETGDCEAEPLTGLACDDEDECTSLDACDDDGECRGTPADTCGDTGFLTFATGTASIVMSNECADDDFDVEEDEDELEDSDCRRASGRDVVFMLDLTEFDRDVTIQATTNFDETSFDTVLMLLSAECSDDDLLACSDDTSGEPGSTFEVSVEPGIYALVVDAYRDNERGEFRLDVVIGAE